MSAEPKLHHQSLHWVQTNADSESWPAEVRDHVSQCECCQRSATASLQLRAGLKRSQSPAAPPELLAQVRQRLAPEPSIPSLPQPAPPRSSAPFLTRRAWVPAALAAGLILGIGLGPLLRSGGGRIGPKVINGQVVKTIGDYLSDVTHDRYLLDRTGRPIEMPSRDRGELSRWLTDGTGFELALGTEPAGWELEGGRVWHTVSRISALAEYADGAHRITVFAVPAQGIQSSGFDSQRVAGSELWTHEAWSFRGVAWFDQDLVWSAVSDLPLDSLVDWVGSYRSLSAKN